MERGLLEDFFVFQQFSFRETKRNEVKEGNRCHYIGFMRRGEGVIRSEGIELSVREGELFYIPKDVPYVSVWSGEEGACFESFGFARFPISVPAYPLQGVAVDEETLALVDALSRHRAVTLASIADLYRLLDRMLPRMTVGGQDRSHRLLERALAYLRDAQELSVPTLARHLGVSESGLYAAFRGGLGCTPVEAWHRVLASRAQDLLLSTDLSVEEIASRLGFCSASYFRKILRRVTGRTPRQIRQGSRI